MLLRISMLWCKLRKKHEGDNNKKKAVEKENRLGKLGVKLSQSGGKDKTLSHKNAWKCTQQKHL